MEKQETMIQKSEYSSPGDNSDAKRKKQEKKENCSKTFQELKMVVLVINPRQLFAKESEFAFKVLFGEDYDSFAYKFYHNLARLENQLSRIENHKVDSKTFVSCFNAIEKEIDARAHHEDKLARGYDSRVNERTMQTQEGMVYMVKDKCEDGLVVKAQRGTKSELKDECSNSRNDTQAEGPDIRLSNDTKPLHEVDQDAEQYLENKTTESLNQTLVSENECLKKTIAKLQQDFSKLEAQMIAFEIALQHKYQENNSLKTLQKENKNFLASLQIENAHLKQTYKDLYESVQRSNVKSNQCDEVKVKVNFDEIETNNIELEHRVSSLLKENEHLKLVYKFFFDSTKKTRVHKENLRATLSEFSDNHICGKEDSSPRSTNELEKESGENTCDNAKSEFQTKVIELEKVLTQQTKDFNDVKLELSKRTAKFEAYFEKLEKTKVVLERQLASKVDDSKAEKVQFLKEINHLRTQLENLKGKSVQTKFDKSLILGEPPAEKLWIASQLSKS
ncbi:hypothetical protein Tco_0467968 [Tanacetum coccineum]